MTEYPRESNGKLKEIEAWSSNVFEWFGRANISKMAPINALFDVLVDSHFGMNRSVGQLEIWRAWNHEGPEMINRFEDGFYRRLSISQVSPPDNLIGFKSICIRYIDDTVVEFLRRIRHLFDTDITLKLIIWPQSNRAWPAMAQEIWPLVVANVSRMYLDSYVLGRLRLFVSPTALRDCANLRLIELDGLFPEGPADDRAHASDGQALSKWLHTARADGRPKLLKFEGWTGQYYAQIEQLQGAFLVASTPVSYQISLFMHVYGDYEPFEVENGKTRERLTFRRAGNGQALWLLKRTLIDQKDEEEAEGKTDWTWTNGGSLVKVQFEDRDIGPLTTTAHC
ncbi:hypothetical protein GPALN_012439 [Globodera pallida]|nr:hypothetical protein GPALN_012439 [Globodera pallida]